MPSMRPAFLRARLLACSIAAASLSIPATTAADEPVKKVAAPDAPDAPDTPKLIVLSDPEPLSPGPGPPGPSGLTWYTGRGPYKRPALRIATGISVRVSGDPSAAYTMDFMLGGHFGLHPGKQQLGLIPEVGYTWRTPGREHQLTAGLGLAWGMGMSYHTVALIPRLVIDPSQGELAFGMRTGLLWCFRENGFAAEIAHQYEKRMGMALNDIRATVSIDVMLLALVVVGVKKL